MFCFKPYLCMLQSLGYRNISIYPMGNSWFSFKRQNTHRRDFPWPRELWKLWGWNTPFGLLKCSMPFTLRPMHRLCARQWEVCLLCLPLQWSLPRAHHCRNLQDNCKLRGHGACRGIATHHGADPLLALPKGSVSELLIIPGLLLLSVPQLIFLCFSCKHQAFPAHLPKDVLAELCLSLYEQCPCTFWGAELSLQQQQGWFFCPFRH